MDPLSSIYVKEEIVNIPTNFKMEPPDSYFIPVEYVDHVNIGTNEHPVSGMSIVKNEGADNCEVEAVAHSNTVILPCTSKNKANFNDIYDTCGSPEYDSCGSPEETVVVLEVKEEDIDEDYSDSISNVATQNDSKSSYVTDTKVKVELILKENQNDSDDKINDILENKYDMPWQRDMAGVVPDIRFNKRKLPDPGLKVDNVVSLQTENHLNSFYKEGGFKKSPLLSSISISNTIPEKYVELVNLLENDEKTENILQSNDKSIVINEEPLSCTATVVPSPVEMLYFLSSTNTDKNLNGADPQSSKVTDTAAAQNNR